jgi:hypothetical protein
MNYYVVDPRIRTIKLENQGIIFRHHQQAIQDGKDKGGKARKSK